MATTKVINLTDFAKELGVYNRKHMDRLKAGAVRAVAKSIPDLVRESPVDTGLYAQSWAFEEHEKGVILGNTAPHAPIIENGARPHTPPLPALLAWAKRVLRDPSQPPSYSKKVRALAIGTQRKIAKYGQEPKKILENAIPGILEQMRREWEAEFG